jgi:hypothetical protein
MALKRRNSDRRKSEDATNGSRVALIKVYRRRATADHAEALAATESLTGHKFKSCPYSGAWQPWVHRVVSAEEQGLAEDQIAHGTPPRALVDAVQIVRRAKRRRDAEEARVARERDSK